MSAAPTLRRVTMKTKMIQTENNQHVVAIVNGDEMRAYFVNHSMHTASAVSETLNRDAARFGQDVGEAAGGFDQLPAIKVRIAKSGRRLYSVAQ